MLNISKVPNQADLAGFTRFVLNQLDATSIEEFSAKLIAAHKNGDNLTAEIQDKIIASNEFAQFVDHPMWTELAADAFDCQPEDILIAFPHLRIDLPNYFKKDEVKMSLPWHQEAGYYLSKGNCCPQSVVLSTYLHDCDQSGGALEVAPNTEADVLDHDQRYMDPVSKRFMRVEVPAPETTKYAETRFGETVIFDFLRRHRSGVNSKDTVRITFLLRASRRQDVEDYARKAAS